MNSSTTEPADSIAAELSPCSLHSPSMHFLPLNFSHCIASVHLSLILPWQGYWGKELRDSLHMQPQRRAVTCNSFQVINQYWVSPSLYSHKKRLSLYVLRNTHFLLILLPFFVFICWDSIRINNFLFYCNECRSSDLHGTMRALCGGKLLNNNIQIFVLYWPLCEGSQSSAYILASP